MEALLPDYYRMSDREVDVRMTGRIQEGLLYIVLMQIFRSVPPA